MKKIREFLKHTGCLDDMPADLIEAAVALASMQYRTGTDLAMSKAAAERYYNKVKKEAC